MPTARVGDHELFHERTGRGEPLLLIMGMSGTHLTWGDPFLDELRRDFEVLVYDHRGIGGSGPAPDPFSIADLAEDAAGMLDVAGWESAHVVGISMGGMVAQELALAHPERVRTLTLGCTYAGGAGSALTSQAVSSRLGEAMLSGDRERAIRVSWEVNVSPALAGDDAQWQEFRRRALELPAKLRTIMAQLQAVQGHDTSARLERIEAPTLVIHGTEDQMLPASNAEQIAARIPGARLELLDGVGHLFFWERPERSAALVRELALAPTARAQ